MRIGKVMSKNSYLIFSAIGAIGVVATAISCGKATLKASDIIKERRVKGAKTTEIAKSVYKHYIPTVAIGVGSIACIAASATFSKKQIAALTAAYISLSDAYGKYKEQVAKLYGPDAEQHIRESNTQDSYDSNAVNKPTDDETLLWYDEYHETFFHRRMIEVIDAEYQLNRKFVKEGEASLNDLFHFLALDDHPEGDILGWSLEADCAHFGYTWVEFEHELVKLEDGMECYILRILTKPYAGYDCPF